MIKIRLKGTDNKPVEILSRNKNNFDSVIFKNRVKEIDWNELFEQTNVNVACDLFSQPLVKILDEMAPLQKIQIRKSFTPWVSDDTKNIMKLRDETRTKAVNSSQEEDWILYRALRNKCTAEVVRDKNKYNTKKYETFEENNDVKNLYKHVKNQMGWLKSGPPTSIRLENGMERRPQSIANILNKFYQDKVKNLNMKLPVTNLDPLKVLRAALERWGSKTDQIKTLKLHPVTRSHTLKLIKKLGNSTSFGLDGIDAISLKVIAEEITDPVNFIVNLSIETSTFPNKWKVGRIIPIFKGKGKDKSLPEAYRPVSLLPALSKVTEKTIQEQLNDHMKNEHLWNGDHHAYKQNHSTATALSQLTDLIFEAAEEKLISVAMSVDETAAFDMINHEMLLKKLYLYKCDRTTITWFRSYLSYQISIRGDRWT